MRDHIYLYILAVTLLLSSCATQRDGQIYQGVEPSQIQAGMVGDDDFELEVSYVGAIGHSFVYECYIKNCNRCLVKEYHLKMQMEIHCQLGSISRYL